MASAIKKCRVCGKEYEACRSANRSAGVFRWQEVACSPECGAVYLQKIEESRGHVAPKRERRKKITENVLVDAVAVVNSGEQAVESNAPGKDPVENE